MELVGGYFLMIRGGVGERSVLVVGIEGKKIEKWMDLCERV